MKLIDSESDIKRNKKKPKLSMDEDLNNLDENQCNEKIFISNGCAEENQKKKQSKKRNTTSDSIEPEPKYKKSKPNQDIKSLRKSLASPKTCWESLKVFITKCKTNELRDLAGEYLMAGGNVLEIAKLLQIEKKNPLQVTNVFIVITSLIMKILGEYPVYQSSAEKACRYILNSHSSLIHSMLLTKSNPKQRKVMLKFFAAMVSLGDRLPRELLNHLSFQNNELELLVKHSKSDDTQSVRMCYIHFILAFLIEGNSMVIRTLLDKSYLLSSIFRDLIYDPLDVVDLVLNTIKKYVLENPSISKTMKLHVFSTNVLQNLVFLYNWKGASSHDELLKEKEVTISIVHDFLITLLTSHRYGVIFHDYSLGTTIKHNHLVETVLKCLDNPWEHCKTSDLIVKILIACPDLIKSQFIRIEECLKPRVSLQWITAMEFVKNIIESLELNNYLKPSSIKLNASQLSMAVINLILPPNIMKCGILGSFDHDNTIVRHQGIILLKSMLEKLEKVLPIIESYYSNNANEYLLFKRIITEYISKSVPNLNVVLKIWETAFQTIDVEHNVIQPSKNVHYNAILDILHFYEEFCPEVLQVTTHIKSSKLLSTLKIYNMEESVYNPLKVKVIQFLLTLDSTEFVPQEEIFGSTLSFLTSLLISHTCPISTNANKTIQMLLEKSGTFEGYEEQIEIWIHAFYNFNAEEKLQIANWLLRVIKSTLKKSDKYADFIVETEEIVREDILHEDILTELMEDENQTKNHPPMQTCTSIPRILCCALKKRSKAVISNYLSYILVRTFHHQVSPEPLMHLIKDIDEFTEIYKYMKNWESKDEEIVQLDTHLSSYETKRCLRETIFYLTQRAHRNILTKAINDKYKIIILKLLDNNTLEYIFTHPIILQYFPPFKRKNNTMELLITSTVLEVCQKLDTKSQYLLSAMKNKLVNELKQVLKNQIQIKTIDCNLINCLVETFQLNGEELKNLLILILKMDNNLLLRKDKSKLSLYGTLIPTLLRSMIKCDNTLDDESIRSLWLRLIYLKSYIDANDWELSFHQFFLRFPYKLSAIEKNTYITSIGKNVHKSTIELIIFLMELNKSLIPSFSKFVIKNENLMTDHSIIMPLLGSHLKYKWDKKFLATCKEIYENQLISYFMKSEVKSWIQNNVESVDYLIKNILDLSTCEHLFNSILNMGDKLEFVDINYIRGLKSLYLRYQHLTIKDDHWMNYLQILLHLTTLALKKDSKNIQKLTYLSDTMLELVNQLKSKNEHFLFGDLKKNHSWPQYTRFSLKLGLKESPTTLKLLIQLCDIVFQDRTQDDSVKLLFDMATSHSQFVNIMLGSTDTKKHLLQLLWTLIKKNHSIMMISHVCLYLASYNATLDEADQLVLMILRFYETNKINIKEYQPFLWGSSASVHYSVKGETDTVLWRQPTATQIFDLFDMSVIKNTIKNYPIDRTMKNDTNIFKTNAKVYDPVFYLPLLCSLLSENNLISCQKLIQSGVLGLVLMSCASSDDQIRMMAFTAVSKCYFHLESSRSKDKLLWMRLIDAVRLGIKSQDQSLETLRINCLVCNFLARASLVISQPLNPLYEPLHKFFMAKPALNLHSIPEFLQLFHSSDIKHEDHRYWILESIRDGIKTDIDVKIVFNHFIYKLLLYFSSCSLSDGKTKLLILEIIQSSVAVEKACPLLVKNYGLLMWLKETVSHYHTIELEIFNTISNIIRYIINNFTPRKKKNVSYSITLVQILLNLKPHLGQIDDIMVLIYHLEMLDKLLTNDNLICILSKQDVEEYIELSQKFLGNVQFYKDMIRYGCKYVKCLDETDSMEKIDLLRCKLHNFVWTCGKK